MNKVLLAAVLALSVGASPLAFAQSATPLKPAGQTETNAATTDDAATGDAATGDTMKPAGETAAQPMQDKEADTAKAIDAEVDGAAPVTEQAETPAGAQSGQQPATAEAPAGTVETTTTTAADGTTVTTTAPDAGSETAAAPAEQPASGAEQPTSGAEQPAGQSATQLATFTKPAMSIENFSDTAAADVNSDELIGANVYDVEENDIGEVGDLVLSADGQTIEGIVLDVGGFLGIGEHHVGVSPDSLQILRNAEGEMRVYVGANEEQLEAQPSYEKAEVAPAAGPAAEEVTPAATDEVVTDENAPAVQPTE